MNYTLTELADIRTRTTYHLARVWLESITAAGALPLTKKPRIAMVTVVDELRRSYGLDTQRHPTTVAAANDIKLAESLRVALADLGAVVDFMPTRHLDEEVLACNLLESAVRERAGRARDF